MESDKTYKVVVVFKDSEKPNVVKECVRYSFARDAMDKIFDSFKSNKFKAKIMMFENSHPLPNIGGMIGVERAGYPRPELIYIT